MSIAETSPAATTGGMGTRAELLAVDADFLWHPWSPSRVNPDTVLAVSGDGCEVRDADGRTYLDAKSSGLNATLGYGSRPVIDAVAGQLARLMTYDMGEGANEPAIRLAERIAGLTGPRLTRTFFCNSGSEAAEAAIRIARFYHAVRGERQRGLVVSFENAYHGATLGAAASSAGASPVSAEFTPAGFVTLPGRTDALRDFLAGQGDRTAAVLIEPVQARGAHQVPDDRLREVRELCSRYGALLILDEVTTGFGRTGRMFGYQHAGVEPDLLTTSKGLAAGYMSLAAVTTTEHVFDVFDTHRKQAGFVHGHTHSGHAAACAAGLAVLDVIERDGLVANAAARGTQLLAALDGVRGLPFVRDIRGRGLLAAVEFDGSPRASLVRRRMKEDGILVRRTGPNIVIAPPLIIDAGRIDRIAGAFTAAAEAAADPKTT
ncbi:aspartate aminotransferase family protein [Streptomyces sp. NPDC090445]|uniref:aminotransferase family protein n=1 Tax=Streptomyces sp. NPDC090445 TaxID=3365963 RepID=UPI00381D7D4F